MMTVGLIIAGLAACGDGSAKSTTGATIGTSPSTAPSTADVATATTDAGADASVPGTDTQRLGTLTVVLGTTAEASDDALDLAVEKLQQRLNDTPGEVLISRTGQRITVTLHDVAEPAAGDVASGFEVGGRLTLRPVQQCTTIAPTAGTGPPADSIPVEPDDPNTTQVLRVGATDEYCIVGPSAGTGSVFTDQAQAQTVGGDAAQWVVEAPLKPGADGEDVLNAIVGECYQRSTVCPSGEVALDLDGELISVATVQTASITGSLRISGSFTEAEARTIARSINVGALPVSLVVESSTFVPN